MMRVLILVHRWLGVLLCLFFAMWFATGIVMHFVPYPTLSETERVNGLSPIASLDVRHGPADAVTAAKIKDATRVRLLQRSDGPVYLVSGSSGLNSLRATDLSNAAVQSEPMALAIAVDHARRRGLDASQAGFIELAFHDQWTVPNGLDPHRPLFRIALNDDPGTELYVSSTTGEVVKDTTRRERWWNYVGSIAHWIYPTALRSSWAAWDRVVWWLSLVAMIGAATGAVLGILRTKVAQSRLVSPYRGWHAWHHWLGLICMTFVVTWIFSGWLSMDHGRLFSTGQIAQMEAAIFNDAVPWGSLSTNELQHLSTEATEVEWFAFGGHIYRRERTAPSTQRLLPKEGGADGAERAQGFLTAEEVSAVANRLGTGCSPAVAIGPRDNYAVATTMPNAPVYRSVCGDVWYHTDAGSGVILEKLDGSRRAYRWLYSALHTLDFPALVAAPILRTAVILGLCGIGLAFSLTGAIIGWRRLRLQFWPGYPPR